MEFDCVIPYGPNDKPIIDKTILHARMYLKNLRNIYIISYDSSYINPGAITIDESLFPFTLNDFKSIVGAERAGWYLQQFLKLYVHRIIPELTEKFLILDADVLFLKPIQMFSDDGIPYYGSSNENHTPYFTQMSNMNPVLKKVSPVSGICHHMFFDKAYLEELFSVCTNNQEEFWKYALSKVSPNDYAGSGFSEYELYFTFLHLYHPGSFIVRELSWKNTGRLSDMQGGYDYISYAHYMR
jgi:hypothetical protein